MSLEHDLMQYGGSENSGVSLTDLPQGYHPTDVDAALAAEELDPDILLQVGNFLQDFTPHPISPEEISFIAHEVATQTANDPTIETIDVQEANNVLAEVMAYPENDSDDDMPSLEDGPAVWHTSHASTSTDLALWNSPNDPSTLQPVQPVLSSTNAPPSMPTAAEMETTSTEAWDEEASFTVIGDIEAGETLPNSTDLFDDSSNHDVQGNSHKKRPYDILLTVNPSMDRTLAFWRKMWEERRHGYPFISEYAPALEDYRPRRRETRPKKITRSEISETGGDMQGIHWDRYAITKAQAQGVRRMTYLSHTNEVHHGTQNPRDVGNPTVKVSFSTPETPAIPNTEHRYRFRTNYTNCIPHWRHYQLRHNIFAASQNAIYYHASPNEHTLDPVSNFLSSSSRWSVRCYNPNTCTRTSVMDTKKICDENAPKLEGISTLSADHNTLVVGSVRGVYGLRSLLTELSSPITIGNIIPTSSNDFGDNSTNHVYTSLSRSSSSPLAVFSSNDRYIRTLDCTTNTWLSKHQFDSPVNCAASSPDTRLRLLVSDDSFPVIADAETGEQYHHLPGHFDHGFACAWAPDGYTLATAHQDGLVNIYDARNPNHTLTRIPAEQACVRSLQFSALGAGPPVLVAAEPADFVHVIDADTFANKQTIEFFGDIAGVSLQPDGQSLWIGCADPAFGGLMEFERRGWGSRDAWEGVRRRATREEGENVEEEEEEDNDWDEAGNPWQEIEEGVRSEESQGIKPIRPNIQSPERRRKAGDWMDFAEIDEGWLLGRWRRGMERELGELLF